MDAVQMVVGSLLMSIGPTLLGAAAWRKARSIDRAVNNVDPGEPTLSETVHQIRRTVVPWFTEPGPGDNHIPLPAQVRILAERQDDQNDRLTNIETAIEGITP